MSIDKQSFVFDIILGNFGKVRGRGFRPKNLQNSLPPLPFLFALLQTHVFLYIHTECNKNSVCIYSRHTHILLLFLVSFFIFDMHLFFVYFIPFLSFFYPILFLLLFLFLFLSIIFFLCLFLLFCLFVFLFICVYHIYICSYKY